MKTALRYSRLLPSLFVYLMLLELPDETVSYTSKVVLVFQCCLTDLQKATYP